ncbi:MAG: ribosomal protein S18-alanine N-acetyltransferase [Clostridia bacterium]|nr:ribosomal protein S18-alanine N-acetyltransferase [Clostridia bacterium]
MQVMLQKPNATDAETVAAIERECFRLPWTEKMIRSAIGRTDFCGVIAFADGKPFGYVLGTQLFEDAELLRIAVLPDFRGQGLGKELLDEFLRQAKRRGAEKVFLEVRVSNLPAITLYQSRGFECLRVREKYYENVEDALEMKKNL